MNFNITTEVRKIPTYKKETLYVNGIQPVIKILEQINFNNVKAVYFGANNSFNLMTHNIEEYEEMILGVMTPLPNIQYCLEFNNKYIMDFLETQLAENSLIPVITVDLPYIQQLSYQTVLQIQGKSNPGIWSNELNIVKDSKIFTAQHELK